MTRTFPIMPPMLRDDVSKLIRNIRANNNYLMVVGLPWEMIEPHAKQAYSNHSQTLERLAERGGLSPCEAVAILEDRRWSKMDQEKANSDLTFKIRYWLAERA